MLIGYCRARCRVQNLYVQQEELRRAGCSRIFSDVASGGNAERPGLMDALDCLQPDDVLVVRRLDRLGRDLSRLLQVAQELQMKGAYLKVLIGGIDTAADGRQLLVHILGTLAGYERRSTRS